MRSMNNKELLIYRKALLSMSTKTDNALLKKKLEKANELISELIDELHPELYDDNAIQQYKARAEELK